MYYKIPTERLKELLLENKEPMNENEKKLLKEFDELDIYNMSKEEYTEVVLLSSHRNDVSLGLVEPTEEDKQHLKNLEESTKKFVQKQKEFYENKEKAYKEAEELLKRYRKNNPHYNKKNKIYEMLIESKVNKETEKRFQNYVKENDGYSPYDWDDVYYMVKKELMKKYFHIDWVPYEHGLPDEYWQELEAIAKKYGLWWIELKY